MNSYLRCFATINLAAVEHNIDQVIKKVNKDTIVLAVVKANAYGHGAIEVARRLKGKVGYFGVAALDEAIILRQAGITEPILILGYTSPSQYDLLLENNITQTIYSYDMAVKMNETGKKIGKKGKIHIALDTGMTRIGLPTDEARIDESISITSDISKLDSVELEGVFTHFSCADMEDKSYYHKQKEKLLSFFDKCSKEGINIPIKHACNSASIMEFDDMHLNMVRSGIITYGMYPSEEVNKEALDLWPAMEFKTHVVNIQEVPAGVGISYGATFVTNTPMKIATLSVGYGDGYKRSISNKGRVLIRGEYAPIVGRVCMDQVMVDVSHIDGVTIEDEATLFGKDGEKFISVEEVADMSESFNYEYVCSLSERVKKVYI